MPEVSCLGLRIKNTKKQQQLCFQPQGQALVQNRSWSFHIHTPFHQSRQASQEEKQGQVEAEPHTYASRTAASVRKCEQK